MPRWVSQGHLIRDMPPGGFAVSGAAKKVCNAMPVPSYRDRKHWRDRANEARAVADLLKDPSARLQMLNIAQAYERMAVNAQSAAR